MTSTEPQRHSAPPLRSVDWQITRRRYPSEPADGELTTDEGRALLSEAASLGATRVLLSGGDPAARLDLTDLVAHGAARGLAVYVLAPALPDRIGALLPDLAAAGAAGLAVALHGPDARSHDAACGAPSFGRTVELIQAAREAGLAIEVRTALLLGRLRALPAMAEVAAAIGAARWTVIAPLGGAGAAIGALALERALVTLADLSALHRFEVAAVAAPHLARVVRMRHGASPDGPAGRVHVERDGVQRLFVSASGDVLPSAELPIPVGHVRGGALGEALAAPLIASLSSPEELVGGKCAVCSFKRLCGGSRARAFADTADLWGEDPSCAHVPRSARRDVKTRF
jgi:MoaA/NifB/PqqE/SkfB family radical SAM enzyme